MYKYLNYIPTTTDMCLKLKRENIFILFILLGIENC